MLDADALVRRQNSTDRDTLDVRMMKLGRFSARWSKTGKGTNLDCLQQRVQIFRFIAIDATSSGCRTISRPIFIAHFNCGPGDSLPIQWHIEGPCHELDGILTNSLVEVRVDLIYLQQGHLDSRGSHQTINTDLCLPLDGGTQLQQARVRSDDNARYCSSYLYRHSAVRQTSLRK